MSGLSVTLQNNRLGSIDKTPDKSGYRHVLPDAVNWHLPLRCIGEVFVAVLAGGSRTGGGTQ
jgi:hypothetical protein